MVCIFQLDEAQFSLKEKERLIPDICAKYDKQIKDLNSEIQSLKAKLITAEEKSKKPSPLLLDLQKEAAELKVWVHHLCSQLNKGYFLISP